MDLRIWIAGACVAALVGCANDGATRSVSAPPSDARGEVVRGPEPDAQVVEARPEPTPTGRQRLDFNDDGAVDREEFRNFFARAFHQVDADDDRVLRGDELAQLPPAVAPRADRDASAGIDVDEYVGLALEWFATCDTDADDVLSPAEEKACQ
jgi:hypothetical protein